MHILIQFSNSPGRVEIPATWQTVNSSLHLYSAHCDSSPQPGHYQQGSSENDGRSNVYDHQNLKLFQTAVTQIAVAPTAMVLKRHFRWIWTILDHLTFSFSFYHLDYLNFFATFFTTWTFFFCTISHCFKQY